MRLKGDPSTSRAMNRRLILNLLRADGPRSRADIAIATGLSRAAVTFVIADLLSENFLIEGETRVGNSGRRPIPLDINYAGRLVVGVQLRVGAIACVLTDLATTPIASLQLPLPDHRPETVGKVAAEASRRLLAKVVAPNAGITGIGLAVPGIVDTASGVCRRCHRFDWTDVPIGAILADEVRVPVWVDDDTNAFALSQQLFGPARNRKTVGALAIGAGVSCAVIVEGSVHHGANGAAGKLGHITVDPEGPMCECGRRGCLQTLFSEPALVQRWRERRSLGPEMTRHDMLAAAQAGDADAIGLLAEAGEGIGRLLGDFCNIVDPEVIVVGGEAVVFGDLLFDPMRAALKRFVLWAPPPIQPDWTDNSWARGAAALATQQLFDFEAVSGNVRAG
ncbi:ROK family transcriptional regulator [Methylocapsa sp. S129]|uniref:ROK family transcriptional regulator n=1 Tax=Methylocapsa sp. S129 TaxID=1641869 RepID=UPI001575B94C|nr:ROK family transcriptional regulator [Methylocapsa sp. S129]